MKEDSYNTIKEKSEGLFKDKGSKFIAHAFPVRSEEEARNLLDEIKKKYHDARHHCYAYKIGLRDDNYRVNDDGEPSGTAGKPIYGQILSNELSDILIVVVRYFGGTLLGTGGLINAYRSAAAESINNAKIQQRVIKKFLILGFSYELMSIVMRIVKDENLEVLEQDFRESCQLILNVRLNDYERISNRYNDIYGVEIQENKL
jgi:uncharacterized YigZ family protein